MSNATDPTGAERLPMLEAHEPLTREEQQELRPLAIAERPDNAPQDVGPFELAALRSCLWAPGRTLHVRFLDGPDEWREQVRRAAEEWTEHANLRFDWDQSYPTPELRVTFTGDVCSSWIGIEAEVKPKDEPTIRLSHRIFEEPHLGGARRYILHEFGHAIGCVHEHSTAIANIRWDREKVYAYYRQWCRWTRPQIDYNVFFVYDEDQTNHTGEYDPDSIMVYPIAKELTLDGRGVDWRGDLSQMDKEHIRTVYPR